MSSQLEVISKQLETVDVTKLVHYTRLLNQIANMNKMMAPNFIRDFISAMDMTNSMLTSAVKLDLDATSALKDAEAIAWLDNASEYLKQKGIKDSNDARKRYVDIDQDVREARDVKAKTEALVAFLKNKLQIFRCAHDDIKKISYGDQNVTPFEGM